MQIITDLWNSKRRKMPEVSGILIFCICIEVNGSKFLKLWESRCENQHSKQPMDAVIKDVIHYIQRGNVPNIYHQRNTKLDFNVCEWGQVESTNEGTNTTRECKWTKYLPRKLNGKDVKKRIISFYHGLSTYAVLLQRMEDNERLWVKRLLLHSEHSAQTKIHELQTYFVTIACIIERIVGNKPKVDVKQLFNNIQLSNDFAHGSSEGNYALKRMETFLEISEAGLKDNKKKGGKSRKEGKQQRKRKTNNQRKTKTKSKDIL
ncbi:hypothetical protein ACJMK2_005457 [Sinanodonta woodiana]|uniref:Uncharacterized protein n=1 Tax=Sinanodonta woodiana TaxID=1069815 RepID=A0ABD3VTL1_SINWO